MIAAALCAMIRRAAHGPMGVTAMGIVEKAQAEAPVTDFDRFSISPFSRRAGRWPRWAGDRACGRRTAAEKISIATARNAISSHPNSAMTHSTGEIA
jgi:hypothetical protein